ncbi:MAG: hypothetical protein IJS13_01840, partial [Paludibacteraceae bacterium]|nr:hypothetical protein [Paludibacteraceae bacterium]
GKTLTVSDKFVLRTAPFASAEFENNGTLTLSGSAKVYYTRVVSNKTEYYPFGLPFNSDIDDVQLSQSISSGSDATAAYGSWVLDSFDGERRATYGADGGNWKRLDKADGESNEIEGTHGYVMWSGSAYYREYYFPVSYVNRTVSDDNTISVTAYAYDSSAPDAPAVTNAEEWSKHNAGWQSIVSPYTFSYGPSGVSFPWLVVSEMTEDNRTYWQHPVSADNPMRPARPYIVQAIETGNMTFGERYSFSAPAPAPSAVRVDEGSAPAETSTQVVRLTATDSEGVFDEANIAFSTRFSADYERGWDVLKMLNEGSRVQLYMELGCGKLAAAALPDDIGIIPLALYSPVSGVYTFSVDQSSVTDRMEHLWLVEDGERVLADLLSEDYAYPVQEGTTRRLSLGVELTEQSDDSNDNNNNGDDIGYGTATGLDSLFGSGVSVSVSSGGRIVVSGVSGSTCVRLYDAAGRLLHSIEPSAIGSQSSTSDHHSSTVSFSVSAAGVYMLQVGPETRRIIVN